MARADAAAATTLQDDFATRLADWEAAVTAPFDVGGLALGTVDGAEAARAAALAAGVNPMVTAGNEHWYLGTIKSFNVAKGYGFIECPEIKNEGHTNDVFLHHAQVGECKVGDSVMFTTFLNKNGRPQAATVTIAARYQNVPAQGESASLAGQTIGNFTGIIGAFNEKAGYGFIRCPALREMGCAYDVFLHRLQLGDCHVGDEVSFAVYMNKKNQPQARDVVLLNAAVAVPGQAVPPAAARPVLPKHDKPKTALPPGASMQFEGRFQGHVKSFSEETGYGFISCAAVNEMGNFKNDVFVHRIQMRGVNVGDEVSFGLYLNGKGQPQATDVIPASMASMMGGVEAGHSMASMASMASMMGGVDASHPMASMMASMASHVPLQSTKRPADLLVDGKPIDSSVPAGIAKRVRLMQQQE